MALAITSASPAAIDVSGGLRLVVTGTFALGVAHQVRVGLNGNDADPLCYSGVIGQGSTCYPASATRLICFTPRLANAVQLLYLRVSAASADPPALLGDQLSAVGGFFYSQTYALRSLMPPVYATGPRAIENEGDLFSLEAIGGDG